MIRSLRIRLLVGASLSSLAVLGLLGLSVYAAMRQALLSDFDASLRTEARRLTSMIDLDGRRLTFDFRAQQMPDFVSGERGRFFQIWREDGTVLARSPSLGSNDLSKPGTMTEPVAQVDLPDDRNGRVILLNFTPRQQDSDARRRGIQSRPVSIVVAAEPIDIHRTLRLLAWMLSILCAAAVMIMGAVLWRVVGHGVRPVKALANEIESVKETDLGRRLEREGVPEELVPMVDKLNGLLGRLEGAFAREKSFTADVAHELRTPLTGLRMTLEVCRSKPREASAYENAIDECRGITDKMEAMVESLLLLARSDAGQVGVARRKVDLSQIMAECWSLFQHRAEQFGLGVSFNLTEPVLIETDPEKLGIVLQNVLDNAVSYADPGGQIHIAVRGQDGQAVAEIRNTGSLIATEDTPRLFERFWRGDVARTDAGVHCGLGLSLCQRLMTLLEGEISVETVKGGQFIVRLRMKQTS